MADDQLDIDAMLERFRERADSVKRRGLPPVAGPERQQFLERAQLDFQDFALLGDAPCSFDEGVLTLTIALRPSWPRQRTAGTVFAVRGGKGGTTIDHDA